MCSDDNPLFVQTAGAQWRVSSPFGDSRLTDSISVSSEKPDIVIIKFMNLPKVLPRADIVVVVDYKPFLLGHFPWTFGKCFRFAGNYGDTWQWLGELVSHVESKVKKSMDSMRKILRGSN
jgi:hypothetical protein